MAYWNTITLEIPKFFTEPLTRRSGEFPAQMASNAENVSIWWRHHGFDPCIYDGSTSILQNVRVQFRLAFWLWVAWILTEVCELLWRKLYCDW